MNTEKTMASYEAEDRFNAIKALCEFDPNGGSEEIREQMFAIIETSGKISRGSVAALLSKWNVEAARDNKEIGDLPADEMSEKAFDHRVGAVEDIIKDAIHMIVDDKTAAFKVGSRVAQGMQFAARLIYARIAAEVSK